VITKSGKPISWRDGRSMTMKSVVSDLVHQETSCANLRLLGSVCFWPFSTGATDDFHAIEGLLGAPKQSLSC
jgi:hypothetical protein